MERPEKRRGLTYPSHPGSSTETRGARAPEKRRNGAEMAPFRGAARCAAEAVAYEAAARAAALSLAAVASAAAAVRACPSLRSWVTSSMSSVDRLRIWLVE